MTSGDRILTGLCYEKDVMASINKVTRWSGSHVSMDNVDREAATGWGMSRQNSLVVVLRWSKRTMMWSPMDFDVAL